VQGDLISVSRGSFDDFLREIPLFANLDPHALSQVQLVARPFQVEAGTTLFRQGDPCDGLYLIKHGEIEIRRRVPGDEEVKLAVLGRSAIVGEMSALDHNPRSTHAIATAPTSGYFISSERFEVLQSDFSAAAFAVMDCFRREVAHRARTVIDAIAAFAPSVNAAPLPACGRSASWPAAASPSSIPETLLHCLPFFRNFRTAELREFMEPLKRFDFSRGQPVYAAGEAPRSCLVIVRGALAMNLRTASGAAMFAVRGPGQMIGELALLDGGRQPLDCMAREPTIAFEVEKVYFELLRKGGSVVALRFFEAVTASAVAMLRKANAHLARLTADGSSRDLPGSLAVAAISAAEAT
jgi:CRP/FNR family cyclic AMP-dependent transcriptional regulator